MIRRSHVFNMPVHVDDAKWFETKLNERLTKTERIVATQAINNGHSLLVITEDLGLGPPTKK